VAAGTLYLYRHVDRPYFVDYCFLPRSWISGVEAFVVGSPERWLDVSDHVPLLLDMVLPSTGHTLATNATRATGVLDNW
jgi:hypothetical protein